MSHSARRPDQAGSVNPPQQPSRLAEQQADCARFFKDHPKVPARQPAKMAVRPHHANYGDHQHYSGSANWCGAQQGAATAPHHKQRAVDRFNRASGAQARAPTTCQNRFQALDAEEEPRQGTLVMSHENEFG